MATECSTDAFDSGSVLRWENSRLAAYSFTQAATSDGPDVTNRTLIDQTVNWTYDGSYGPKVLAHVLFHRPGRYIRAQNPRNHYINEEWAMTSDGSAPSITGSTTMSIFGGGGTRNQSNMWWPNLEPGTTWMPPGLGQITRTSGQQIRVRYQARLSVSSSGATNCDVRSYQHRVLIVITPLPIV